MLFGLTVLIRTIWLKNAHLMDVVGTIDENVYKGNRNMQILIKDIRIV